MGNFDRSLEIANKLLSIHKSITDIKLRMLSIVSVSSTAFQCEDYELSYRISKNSVETILNLIKEQQGEVPGLDEILLKAIKLKGFSLLLLNIPTEGESEDSRKKKLSHLSKAKIAFEKAKELAEKLSLESESDELAQQILKVKNMREKNLGTMKSVHCLAYARSIRADHHLALKSR